MQTDMASRRVLRAAGLGLALSLLLAAVACNKPQATAAWKTGDPEIDYQIQRLLELDLHEAVERTRYLDPTDPNLANTLPRSFRDIFDPPLTPGEKRQLGSMITADGVLSGSEATLKSVLSYYDRERKLPANGAVILAHLDAIQFSGLMSAGPDEQLRRIYAGINPVTGRCFESFSRSDWHPGGLYFEPCTDPERVAQLERDHQPIDRNRPMEYWQVTFFGERPDHTPLVQHYLVSNGRKRLH